MTEIEAVGSQIVELQIATVVSEILVAESQAALDEIAMKEIGAVETAGQKCVIGAEERGKEVGATEKVVES